MGWVGLGWVWFGMGLVWVWYGFGMGWVWYGLGLVWVGFGIGWVWYRLGLVWVGFGVGWVDLLTYMVTRLQTYRTYRLLALFHLVSIMAQIYHLV